MARLARLAIDQQLHHLVHRAASGVEVLADEADRRDYLDALLSVSRDLDVAVHAYVLLPDRVQLLLTPANAAGLSTLMQRIGRRFGHAFNRRHGRTGSPWDGRFRSTVLQAERHLIDAMRLIDAAPARLGLVEQAEAWPASSAAHHAGRRVDPLVTDHAAFWALGNTPFEREARYRRLLAQPLAPEVVGAIESATAKGWALGDADFIRALSHRQARRLLQHPRGRKPLASTEFDSVPN